MLTNNGSGNLSWSNSVPFAVASGTNAITFSLTPAITSYTTGVIINFKNFADNTTHVTLNVDGLGAKALFKNVTDTLLAGDIKANQIIPMLTSARYCGQVC